MATFLLDWPNKRLSSNAQHKISLCKNTVSNLLLQTSHSFVPYFDNHNSQSNLQIEHPVYFLVTSTYNRPNKFWSKKLYHPTIGERQKRTSLLPRASSYAEALLLFSIFTYSKSILFIALSYSSLMNLLSLVLLEPSSISYLNLILRIGTV